MKKYIVDILALSASLAFASVNLRAGDDPNMHMHKSVSGPDNNGVYTLTLESYAKGAKVKRAAPIDIVLVLDTSGSMNGKIDVLEASSIKSKDELENYLAQLDKEKGATAGYYWMNDAYEMRYYDGKWQYNSSGWKDVSSYGYWYRISPKISKINSLKAAVTKFIDNLYSDTQTDYDGNGAPDNISHRISIIEYNTYVFLRSGFVNVSDSNNASNLKSIVNGFSAGGATRADNALAQAKKVFEDTRVDGIYPNRPRVLVYFTDGEPTGDDGTVSTKTADAAIAISKTIKATSSDGKAIGAKVYTIGTFDNPVIDVDTFMNYMSSNYPDASSMDVGGTKAADTYEARITNGTALNSIFNNISVEIGGVDVTIDETSSVIDYLTKEFSLPAGVKTSDIKVYTAAYDAFTQSFGAPRVFTDASVSLDAEKGEIHVTNFNFSANWCGIGATNGHKLIIEIPIVESADNKGGIDIPTNETDSGIYETGASVPSYTYVPPTVSIPVLKIVKTGMRQGESAVFTVTDGVKKLTICLTGTGNDLSTSINAAYGKTYTVTEKDWSWTYTPETPSSKSVTFVNGDYIKSVEFTNVRKDVPYSNAEAVVKNNFKTQTHTTSKTQ